MTDATQPRVITEPLGGSPLSQALQAQRLPREMHAPWPTSVEQWRDLVNRSRADRWYDHIAPALGASGAALQRLERVVAEGGVCVTTGQQAGLFGGPLYTLAKALTAVALADVLQRALGVPVAPVFWAATDDADFDEAARTFFADAEGLHDVSVESRPPAGTPMFAAPLGDLSDAFSVLKQSSGSVLEPDVLELARHAYGNGATVGSAYVMLLRGLLEPLGVSVLDAASAAYHRAARPLLLTALDRAAAIASAVAERTDAIRTLGFEPQVVDDRGLSLVFELSENVKRRIPVAEAASFRRAGDDVLLPNVLLRPIVERELLPTVAYIGGPGELAYFIQTNAVAAALDRPPVVGVPRWSGTVVESFAQRALARLGIEPHDLRDLRGLERRFATAAVPDRVASAWARLQEQVRRSVSDLGDAVREEKLMPTEVIEGLERSLGHRLERGERRLLSAAKRRDAQTRRDLRVAASALYPMGKRQERILNFVPMLARGGDALVQELRAAATAHATTLVRSERAETVAAR